MLVYNYSNDECELSPVHGWSGWCIELRTDHSKHESRSYVMPVVRQQKVEEASEIQAGPPLNGNTLPHALKLFHNHHEQCSGRRRNGVNYEIRVEFERTKWLKRKYMDNLRQQQALTGRLDGPRTQLNSSSDSAESGMVRRRLAS